MDELGKLIKVLLVEDDPEDVELTLEVMKMTKIKLKIDIASDGFEAMEYLKMMYETDTQQLPDIMLLDINMPRMNGHEVIKAVKSEAHFKHIPIVVLTTSKSEVDIAKSYSNGISCYITKPVGLQQFQQVVEAVNNFWFTVVKFPSN